MSTENEASNGDRGVTVGLPDLDPAAVGDCPTPRSPYGGAKEETEVALGLMWWDFARHVQENKGPADLHWTASEYASDGLRKWIFDIIDASSLNDFLTDHYIPSRRAEWLETAEGCASACGIIQADDISRSWKGGYGQTTRHTDPAEHGAEVIAGCMWFRCAASATRNDYTDVIDDGIIRMGRGLSGEPVVNSIRNNCMPGGRLDLTLWDHTGVGVCTWEAGRLAANKAAGNRMQTAHFTDSWCEVRARMGTRIRLLTELNYRIVSNAC